MTAPFLLLNRLFADPVMTEIFGEDRTISGWLEAERALALAQSAVGVIPESVAAEIAAAARIENIDHDRLWREARNVGYPILPLVRMIAAALPDEAGGRVHYGATTQDIMDTGLALQLGAATRRLDELVTAFGDAVAELVERHRHTVLAARTHGQQAVPTTFGAKLSVLLAQLSRQRTRVRQVQPRVTIVSLYGAGGTSAALGEQAPAVRAEMASQLKLGVSDVPWHVARDSLAEFGYTCAGLAATCARFAGEIIDLSRTEIGELAEPDGHHRGASSTMPQKANPISSEAIIGMAATAAGLSGALGRAIEAGHERAAGEWQIEWEVLPQLAILAASCARLGAQVSSGLQVFPEAMRHNLAGSGYVMAEAYMMRLADTVGRERAHDLVYTAVREARKQDEPLEPALKRLINSGELDPIAPDAYLGAPDLTCDAALRAWTDSNTSPAPTTVSES